MGNDNSRQEQPIRRKTSLLNECFDDSIISKDVIVTDQSVTDITKSSESSMISSMDTTEDSEDLSEDTAESSFGTSSIIFAFECSDYKYYIGSTTVSIEEELEKHLNGIESEWTKVYRPNRIVHNSIGDKLDEEILLYKFMEKYGINNVRGRLYNTVELSDKQIVHLNRKITTISASFYNFETSSKYRRGSISPRNKTSPRNNTSPRNIRTSTLSRSYKSNYSMVQSRDWN
jgi:hypothetical protein